MSTPAAIASIAGQQRQLFLKNCSLDEELIVLLERAETIILEKVDGGLKEAGVLIYDRGDRGLINTPPTSTSTLGSFTTLTVLTIADCGTCKYLFSPSCARRISLQLKRLEVRNCEMMEQIVGIDDDHGETNTNDHHEIIVEEEHITAAADVQKLYFNRLDFMWLDGLPNLIGFYPRRRTMSEEEEEEAAAATTTTEGEGDSSTKYHQHQKHIVSLFNEKVAFPALEYLYVLGLPKITAIWDQPYESLQFPNKEEEEEVEAEAVIKYSLISCDREKKPVNNMLPTLYFQNLKDLGIYDCRKLEAIAVLEEAEENVVVKEEKAVATSSTESDDHHIHILVFPRLEYLELDNLENLLSFYSKYRRRRRRSDQGAQLAWLDHNHQVGFPELKKLRLNKNYMNQRLSRLWHGLASNLSLETLRVEKCTEVSTAVPPHLLPRLQNVDSLVVGDSPGMREAFDLEGLRLHVGELGEGQYVTQGLLTTKVRGMHLFNLPQLTCLWNKHPTHGILDLRNLKVVTIARCPLLRTPFTPSVAMALEQLETLWLESCTMMEEVVIATDDDHPAAAADVGIRFPKLRVLALVDLPNVTSFCSATNYNIHLPSLGGVLLNKCPKMHTFTSGLVHMPPQIVFCTSVDVERLHIQDLNKHLEEEQRRLLEGDQNTNEDITGIRGPESGHGTSEDEARRFISEFGVDARGYPRRILPADHIT